MNAGSQWRKWNFHVHTKGTNKNDLFTSPSMEEFFCVFFKKAFANKIHAIGVTDYFSIDRYKDAVEYIKNIDSKIDINGNKLFDSEEISFIKNIFLFPNVELRMLPSTDSARLINIHCLFNPEYVPHLEHDFFSNVKNQEGYQMNNYGISMYGKHLDSALINASEQYKKGLKSFLISIESLKELLGNKRFRDNTLFVVSNSNKDGASAIQKHYDLFESDASSLEGIRQSIYFISDAVFSANNKDVKYFLGKKSEGSADYDESVYKKEVDQVVKERGSLKACLVGCDAHKEADLFSKFTWIKSDLSFEGLRQICFEPEGRVKLQNDEPEFKEEKLLIEKVRFLSPNNVFTSDYIHFSPNLNVIIGGKSSGKSILLYSIAKALSSDYSILKNENDSYKYDFNKIEDGLDFEITTKGGFSQNLSRNEETNSILPEIKYIPQNYLVKLAEPELNRKGRSLNQIVRDLIIEDSDSKDLYTTFVSKVVQNDRLRNNQIDLYFETKAEIADLESELKTKSNKEVLEKNIESNAGKVEEYNKKSGLDQQQVEDYKGLQNILENNNVKRQNFKEDLLSTQAFNSEFVQIMKGLKQRKDSMLSSIQLPEVREQHVEQYKLIDDLYTLSTVVESTLQMEVGEDGKRHFVNECRFKEILEAIRSERNLINEAMQPYLANELNRASIEELNQSIASDKKSLIDIVNIAKKIDDKKALLKKYRSEIFATYQSSYLEYVSVIEQLKHRAVELEKDGLGLRIEGKSLFNFSKLRRKLIDVSDGRSASYNKYDVLSETKKVTDEVDFASLCEQIEALFDDVVNKNYALLNKTSIPGVVKIILDDYFFDYWEISYKNDRLGEMSTGKASFVILMLIIGLSKSKAPILIDQPEDNLDNRSITTDLVNYLRVKKRDRQIIVVTHNANIVVNADAENVIVANQKGQNNESSTSPFRFDYINGAIENSFDKKALESDVLKSMGIRQHIADIVEGGKDAFIMREKKYRFS